MKKYYLAILIVFIIFMSSTHVYAQCCGAGNPISISGTDNNLRKNHMQVSLDYRHSASDKYYKGSKLYTEDFFGRLENASYDFMNLGVSYGITSRWTVQSQIGFYIDKQENFKNDLLPDASVWGFGDLSISTSYVVWRNIKKGIELAPFVMVKFPVGKFDCEKDGIKLPISMQPSSGSYKYAAGFYFYSNLSRRWYLTSYNLFEYAQRIKSNNFNYKYGNLTYINVATYYKAWDFMSAGVNLSYEYMSNSKDEFQTLEGTSYHLVKVVPQLLFRPVRKFNIVISGEIPIWRHVNGIQMSNLWAIQVKLVYDISFF